MRKSSLLCCRVPEEGAFVITQGERTGAKERDVRELQTEQETEAHGEKEHMTREETK